jgi:pyridoxine 4-dehydrogenase
VSVQNRYNLADRDHEDVLNDCEEHDLGFIPWAPVAAGGLTRPGGALGLAATKYKATVAQFSIAWLLYRSPFMLPIPGTSSVDHLEENVATAILVLPKEEWQKIEHAVAKQTVSAKLR